MVRVPRIELGSKRWQRSILPLNYTRIKVENNARNRDCRNTTPSSVVLVLETVQSRLFQAVQDTINETLVQACKTCSVTGSRATTVTAPAAWAYTTTMTSIKQVCFHSSLSGNTYWNRTSLRRFAINYLTSRTTCC